MMRLLKQLEAAIPPYVKLSELSNIAAVTLTEGGLWIEDKTAVDELCLHAKPFAVRMKDGRVWDRVAGWRPGR